MTAKGPGEAIKYDASALRVGIVHSRWNSAIIDSLLSGARKELTAAGVQDANIVVQSVPGSYELPFAVQRMYAASTSSAASGLVSAATDLLGSTTSLTDTSKQASVTAGRPGEKEVAQNTGPLDVIIAIGVLIKGSTMHFEYIADAVSHGLMKVQLDQGVPVVFGVLTCLTEEQAYTRAGLSSKPEGDTSKLSYAEQGHNHGEDWGKAAVEMAVKRIGWVEGRYVE